MYDSLRLLYAIRKMYIEPALDHWKTHTCMDILTRQSNISRSLVPFRNNDDTVAGYILRVGFCFAMLPA